MTNRARCHRERTHEYDRFPPRRQTGSEGIAGRSGPAPTGVLPAAAGFGRTLKTGSGHRRERVANFNQLLRIERHLGESALDTCGAAAHGIVVMVVSFPFISMHEPVTSQRRRIAVGNIGVAWEELRQIPPLGNLLIRQATRVPSLR